MTWWQTLLIGLLSPAGAVVVTKMTLRQSDRAAAKTAEVEARAAQSVDRATEVDGFDRLTQRLEARLDDVEAEAAACREENRELRGRVDALEEENREIRTLLRDTRTLFSLLLEYARTLRSRLLAIGQDVPEPPRALTEHLLD